MTDVRIIDRFAGPGGWDTGLRMLGRTDVVGIEWDTAACETARANGHRRVQADIALLDPQEFVDEHLGGRAPEGGIDSPPCQGFSMAGKGLGRGDTLHVLAAVERIAAGECVDVVLKELRALCADPRTALVLEPLRWALALRPQWLAWEQVPAVLPLWEACAQVLRAHGYSVWVQVLSAEQYGVPQTRKRACLGASRVRIVAPPVPTHSRYYPRTPAKLDEGVLPWVSMAQALGSGMTHRPSMTVTGGGSATGGAEPFGNGARQGMLREIRAGRWWRGDVRSSNGAVRDADLPSPTLTASMDNGNFRWEFVNGNQANSARRDIDTPAPTIHFAERQRVVEWQPTAANDGTTDDDMAWTGARPSPTIVGSFAPDVVAAPRYRKAGDGPRQKAVGSVRVTVAEAAVLQSFPADYDWQGSATARYRQVGDAVPPLLAAHVLWSVGADGRFPWVS